MTPDHALLSPARRLEAPSFPFMAGVRGPPGPLARAQDSKPAPLAAQPIELAARRDVMAREPGQPSKSWHEVLRQQEAYIGVSVPCSRKNPRVR